MNSPDTHQLDTMVALARLEGKVDMLPSLMATHATSIERLQERQNVTDTEIAALKAVGLQRRDWIATAIALLAAAAAIATPFITSGG